MIEVDLKLDCFQVGIVFVDLDCYCGHSFYMFLLRDVISQHLALVGAEYESWVPKYQLCTLRYERKICGNKAQFAYDTI